MDRDNIFIVILTIFLLITISFITIIRSLNSRNEWRKIIEEGEYVVCAVSGKNIPLNQLTYWNVELQEAYFSPKEAQQRFEELNKK